MVDDVSWEGELSLGCGEVWEYLYHNHTRINHITNPVSVTPVSPHFGTLRSFGVWNLFKFSRECEIWYIVKKFSLNFFV